MARLQLPALLVLIVSFSLVSVSQAQIFGGGFAGNGDNGTGNNSVDFDLSQILNCQPGIDFDLDSAEPPLSVICGFLLEELIDQLVEAERFLDEVFIGYRSDSPRFFRNQLDGPVQIEVVFAAIDGAGGVLASAGPHPGFADFDELFAFFGVNPFLRRPGVNNLRNWVIPRRAIMNLDIDDVIPLLLSETMIDVAVHEAFHAMGHPTAFELSELNAATSGFGQINFIGDPVGINGAGYGLTKFRAKSGNILATFVPLSQNDDAAHLSPFEPTFIRLDEGFQDTFIPFAPPPGVQAFMSFSLQGMFADLGYKVRGINAPGVIDIDNDGQADNPVIINPIFNDHGD